MTRQEQRVALRYTGEQAVTLPASAHARPGVVEPGDTVVVDAWAERPLTLAGEFVPLEVAVGELKGKALDDALEAAGLPTTGKADEKRDRLTAHTAMLAEQGTTTDAEGASTDE